MLVAPLVPIIPNMPNIPNMPIMLILDILDIKAKKVNPTLICQQQALISCLVVTETYITNKQNTTKISLFMASQV